MYGMNPRVRALRVTVCVLARSISLLALFIAGCGAPDSRSPGEDVARAPLVHEAYVWQRAWTAPVRDAVAEAPRELSGLRVLALEIAADGTASWPAVAIDALRASRRPITAVVRIDGSRPIADLSLAPVVTKLAAWRDAGVDVAGVEIDHDCATAALADYAAWLRGARVPAPLRWSITALPTWTESAELARVIAAVDESVVQVHAIRAPVVFEPRQARRWVEAFAAATAGRPFRVAVPTYRVVIDGVAHEADPREVAGFVHELARAAPPGLRGIVWFRLPVASDRATWRVSTLRVAINQLPLVANVRVRLVPHAGGTFDVVLSNDGTLDARYPGIALEGPGDLVAGYRHAEDSRWTPPARLLAAGETIVIGWATGKREDLYVSIR